MTMRAGTCFTYNGTRYEAGDPFRLEQVPAHQQGSFRRLYQLTEPPKRRKAYDIQEKETT